MKTQKLTAISYIRFSTPEQQKGDSLHRQIVGSQEWCQRNGYVLDTSLTLRDLGVPAFRGRNVQQGALKVFLDKLKAGEITADALIVESLDRVTRQEPGKALQLFLEIISTGMQLIVFKPMPIIFTMKSINEMSTLMTAVMELCRGYGESQMKSERVGPAWKRKKEHARHGHKVSACCPGWLRLVGERSKDLNSTTQHFEFVPAKVAAVKRLIQLANSGIGLANIAKRLNQEGQPILKAPHKGNKPTWHASAVYKVLTNRALMGEYQPRFSNRYLSQKHRQPDGDAIPGYYPALLTEAEFLQIQSGLETRRAMNHPGHGGGKTSLAVTNLFGRSMKDARTGATIMRRDKGKKSVPTLISGSAVAGLTAKQTFPYNVWEHHFLFWLSELTVKDLSNERQTSAAAKRLLVVRKDIAELSARLKKLKIRLVDEDDTETLIDVVKELDGKVKTLRQEEETLKVETGRANPIGEAGTLIKALADASDEQRIELRSKLRFLLSELIDVIYVRMEGNPKTKRYLFAQVHFRNGLVRRLWVESWGVYTHDGKKPIPATNSRSHSTPQELTVCDLRTEADFVGWLAGVLVNKEILPEAARIPVQAG